MSVSRVNGIPTYPPNFIFITVTNPCSYGYYPKSCCISFDDQIIMNIKECYFLNNFAVIEILKGNFVPEVEKNLKNALLFKPSKYEEGIILSLNIHSRAAGMLPQRRRLDQGSSLEIIPIYTVCYH